MKLNWVITLSFIVFLILNLSKIISGSSNLKKRNNIILEPNIETFLLENHDSNPYSSSKNYKKIIKKRIKRENKNKDVKYFLRGIFDHEGLFCVEEKKRYLDNNAIGYNDIYIAAMFEDNKLTSKIIFIKFLVVDSIGILVDEKQYNFLEKAVIKLLTNYWSFEENPDFYHHKYSKYFSNQTCQKSFLFENLNVGKKINILEVLNRLEGHKFLVNEFNNECMLFKYKYIENSMTIITYQKLTGNTEFEQIVEMIEKYFKDKKILIDRLNDFTKKLAAKNILINSIYGENLRLKNKLENQFKDYKTHNILINYIYEEFNKTYIAMDAKIYIILDDLHILNVYEEKLIESTAYLKQNCDPKNYELPIIQENIKPNKKIDQCGEIEQKKTNILIDQVSKYYQMLDLYKDIISLRKNLFKENEWILDSENQTLNITNDLKKIFVQYKLDNSNLDDATLFK